MTDHTPDPITPDAELRAACENTLAGRSVDSFIDPHTVLSLLARAEQAERQVRAVEALRALEAGTREPKPYEQGEKVYLYCGKAGRDVEHTIMAYPGSKPYALCGHGGCTRTAPALPKRYRVTEAEFQTAAAKAVRAALSGVSGPTEAGGAFGFPPGEGEQ